jgi:hypothetical protein
MSVETCKCPRCGEVLNADNAISHLTVKHQVPLREAYRWAGFNLGVLGQADGMGQTRNLRCSPVRDYHEAGA